MADKNDQMPGLIDSIDDISELIYVADMETYDLLYMNRAGRETFHLDSLQGLKCYKALQHFDSPCPFCTNHLLQADKNYSWEYTSPVTGRHYFLKDRLINWNDRHARLEIAFDVTDYERERNDLQYALDTERLVLDCIRILYQGQNLNLAINQVLQLIGQYLCADRAYIFKIYGDKMDNTYEWCRSGVAPQIDELQGLDASIVFPWKNALENHQCIVLKNIEDVKGTLVYDILLPQNIQSLVIAPLEKDGKLDGYFGVDNPPMEKLRNIISLLETLRYFIMVTLQRHLDEEQLQRLSIHDTLTGLYNRNKYTLDVPVFSNINAPVGVVYLDCNGLKEINDDYGHAQGDQILIKCTEKIRAVFQNDNLYRTGGDEFVIISLSKTREKFLALVDELKNALIGEHLSVAIGHAWKKSASELKNLITLADRQMYDNKRQYYQTISNAVFPHREPRSTADFPDLPQTKSAAQ